MFVPAPNREETAKLDKEPPKQPYLVSPTSIDTPYAQEVTAGLIELLFRLEEESEGQFKVVRTSSELAACFEEGVLAAVMHFEGAECIEPDLSNLATYYNMGLRSLGLTWSRSNAFAYGVPFGFPHSPDTGPGLTDAGKEFGRQMQPVRHHAGPLPS
jgi:membrane dipeptidase